MNLTSVKSQLESSIKGEASKAITPEQINNALRVAMHALEDCRPIYANGRFTLKAGQAAYVAPNDLVDYSNSQWSAGAQHYNKSAMLLPTPRVHATKFTDGKKIEFYPAPTRAQLSAFGSQFDYRYKARHELTEDSSTLGDRDLSIFMIRAQAEIMRDLTVMNVIKPIQLHKGIKGSPVSGTPQAVFDQLMAEYRRLV